MISVAQERDAKYSRDNHLFSFVSIRNFVQCRKNESGEPDPRLVTTQQKRSRSKKKIHRARADLRNCSERDDEIVPVRTRRDSRRVLTAMTYDLEYLILPS